MSKNTAPATPVSVRFKHQGKTFTFTGTPLEVANAKRTIKAAEEKMGALVAKSVRAKRGRPGQPKVPTEASVIRQWARETGREVGERGRLHPDLVAAYREAQSAK